MEAENAVAALKSAIDREDFDEIKRLMTADPSLHRAPMGYGEDGPLTWVAECRVPRRTPSETRLAIARWMIENGSDVHQGGDGPLMRAAMADERLPMLELLVEQGADVNAKWHGTYPILWTPCECLAPGVLRRLLELGADTDKIPSGRHGLASMLVGTYCRDAKDKGACLEVLADLGYPLPDTPVMALHRSRTDLLARDLALDPQLLSRRFGASEIYPAEIGCDPADGLTATPVDGACLLHLALEFEDLETATWLLDHGADPNGRTGIDAEGYGGLTPLFYAVVSIGGGGSDKVRLLLDRGADPNLRATFRKQLVDMGDPEKERMTMFRDVTAAEYARGYVEPSWVCEEGLELLDKR